MSQVVSPIAKVMRLQMPSFPSVSRQSRPKSEDLGDRFMGAGRAEHLGLIFLVSKKLKCDELLAKMSSLGDFPRFFDDFTGSN